MKPFSKNEIWGLALILLVLFAATSVNLVAAIRRARDAQRRSDLGAISEALDKFQADFGFFPPDVEGKILACKGANFDEVVKRLENEKEFDRNIFFEGLVACDWGRSHFSNLISDINEVYMPSFPQDPKTSSGSHYLYFSNTSRYQIYASLEGGSDEVGFDDGIVKRSLACGAGVCNFGKSFAETPLNKSIEEYEEELRLLRIKELGTGID